MTTNQTLTAVSTTHSVALASAPAIMFIASVATLTQSFVLVKLFFLVVFLASGVVSVAVRQRVVIHPRLVAFYLVISLAGIVWSLVGLVHPANYVQGVFDAVRLYVLWSVAFVILYTLFRSKPSLGLLHLSMVTAGILIPLINFAGLVDTYFGLGLISEGVRTSMDLWVGIHDGYIQITSQNIGSMFLIAPYLIAVALRQDVHVIKPRLTRWALVMSLVLVIVSGRRALWLVVALTPCAIFGWSILAGSFGMIKFWGRRVLLGWVGATVFGASVFAVLPEMPEDNPIGHLQEAFSSVDERSIQKPYLIEGFAEEPVLGSGFGAAAAYLRDFERPWTGYELTYYQMLFNLGVVGVSVLGGLFAFYFVLVLRLLRRFRAGSAVPFAAVVAISSFLLGAYSNRYFGSFDLLFFVGLLPYLSTFVDGFEDSAPVMPAT